MVTPAGASLPARDLKKPRQRAKRADSGVSRAWSDERRAKFAETIAARKAGQAAYEQ